MMRLILFFLLLWQPICYSQCDGRYLEEVFSDVVVSTVTYSEANNLQLDIYQPVGDTENNRPLIILAHGGSFIAGVRASPSMVSLGEAFAKRGYVVASISYRLMTVLDLIFSSTTLNGVSEALSDGKAAVRYFRKSVVEGNAYNIDPNQIYFGGNSAGAIIAIHAAFMQEGEVENPELIVAMENNGGFEGNSGNPGFSSDVRGAISLAGGIADLDFINSSDFNSLLITCHGDLDNTVVYDCGEPLSGIVPIELCGGGAILEHSSLIGFENHHHLLFEGSDHTPWEWGGAAENQMISFVSEKLFNNLDCANSTGEPLDVLGCMDSEACNYNPSATQNDGSCTYADLYYDCDGNCINDIDMDGECDEVDYDDGLGMNELDSETPQVIKMIDVVGRVHTSHKSGLLLFYIYNNGKVRGVVKE